MEVLEILEEEGFLEHVRKVTGGFKKGFGELRVNRPEILLESMEGLMMGLKTVNEACGPLITLAGFRHEVLTLYANNEISVSRALPSLIIGEGETEMDVEALDEIL